VPLARGRGLGEADRDAQVVVLGDGLWRRSFGAEPGVVGGEIRIDGLAHTVVGVAARDLRLPGLGTPDLWLPLPRSAEAALGRGSHANVFVVGRLAPGRALAEARDEMERLAAALAARHPQTNLEVGVGLLPWRERLVRDARRALLVVWGAVGFVLLIACVNVANLLLVRAARRERELAVRVALGAGRGQLVRQLLAESLVLGLLGGAAGLLLAAWGVDLLRRFADDAATAASLRLDAPVLLFTLGLGLLVGPLMGLLPALRASGGELGRRLRQGGRQDATPASGRLLRLLMAVEIGLAVVLAVAAGLLVRSVRNLWRVDPGFTTDGVLALELRLPAARYPVPAQRGAFFERLLERAGGLPGAAAVALVDPLPLAGSSSATSIDIEGFAPEAGRSLPSVRYQRVSAEYFDALDLPLLWGRSFAPDELRQERAAVVNRAFVERFWPGAGPGTVLGRRLRPTGVERPWLQVVGVVETARYRRLDEPPDAQIYLPWQTAGLRSATLLVRAAGDDRPLAEALRREARALDPDLALAQPRRMGEVLEAAMASRRLPMQLLALLAAVALGLAALGTYAVVAYTVSQRTREFGVRMVLGAGPAVVVRLAVAETLRWAGAAVVIGAAAAVGAGTALSGLLFGVAPADPPTLAATSALLLLVAAGAAYLPARRAARVDPLAALRLE
jgi:predicted permease